MQQDLGHQVETIAEEEVEKIFDVSMDDRKMKMVEADEIPFLICHRFRVQTAVWSWECTKNPNKC
eukprot:10117058-Ditylum_brightwellii.AAC.1